VELGEIPPPTIVTFATITVNVATEETTTNVPSVTQVTSYTTENVSTHVQTDITLTPPLNIVNSVTVTV
jgi:hypothetical protein